MRPDTRTRRMRRHQAAHRHSPDREVNEVPRTTPNMFIPGEGLLSPDPVWVFVNRQFYCGLSDAPTPLQDRLIHAGNPHATIVYLRADAPITQREVDTSCPTTRSPSN